MTTLTINEEHIGPMTPLEPSADVQARILRWRREINLDTLGLLALSKPVEAEPRPPVEIALGSLGIRGITEKTRQEMMYAAIYGRRHY